jgi:penicillin-binding protein 2
MNSQSANKYHVHPWRVFVVYGLIVAMLVLIIYRLFSLQVLGTQAWIDQAVENYTTEISDPASRGIIYDRNGHILARNVASYNVVITPAGLPDDEADTQRIYREVSELTGVPVGGPVTEETLNNAKLFSACLPGPSIADMVALGESLAPYIPVKIICNIDEELARVIREKSVDWPGVTLEIEPVRDYPTGSLTANIIGFLGPIPAALEDDYRERGFVPNRDKIGYSGVETSLDEILLGKNGLRVAQIDVAGQVLRNLEPPRESVPGNNVVLTIDTRLQKAAEAALTDEINFWNANYSLGISSGVVIAMNPKTGEILAMVSYPTFENNRMARFIPGYYYEQLIEDPRHPLVNNAISAELPPGSVFKLSTATGAFNEEVIRPGKIVQTPGKLELCERFRPTDPCTGRTRPFVDWIYNRGGVINEAGFGALDFFHCIAYSSNVCFYKLGGGFEDEIPEGLGIFRLGEYARALGYDELSGIQLPGEEDGLIPDPQWKRINQGENWSTGDTYIASVGQGLVTATPLQILMSGATIANHGKLMQPTIVREVLDSEGRVIPMWFNPALDDFSVYEVREVQDREGRTRKVWVNPADPTKLLSTPPVGSYQISPFTPNMKWDITVTPMIEEFSCDQGYCEKTGKVKVVQPATVEAVRTGTRLAVTEDPLGTLHSVFMEDYPLPIAVAGKTGTAEYCDDVASKALQCEFGSWPTHAWTLAYAPYDDPEIIILAFAYHGSEGGTVAAPIVARVMQAYFELKSIDLAQGAGSQ